MPNSRTVFIVDEDPQVRHGLWRVLARRGWSFRMFGDARSALAALEDGSPDLVVADLDLPDLDGVAFLGAVHRRDPAVRKILVSGTEMPPGARTALRDGFVDALAAKPAGNLLPEMARQLVGDELDDDWFLLAG